MTLTVIVAHNRYRSQTPSGENRVVEQEVRLLERAGVRVIPFIASSDDIPSLPIARKMLLPLSPIHSPHAQRELADLITTHRADLVHLHNPYPLLSPSIVRTAHAHGLPVIQTVHNYRHVCVSGLYFRDGRICHDCRSQPLAAVRHRCYRRSLPQTVIMAAALRLHRSTWRGVDRFLAPTSVIENYLSGYGIPLERITIKPNSVEDPGPPSAVPGQGVLFAGRPTQDKGIELLAQACARAGVPLVLAGGRHPAARSLGVLDAAGVRQAIRASAVVAVPSLLADVFPTIALEALANGRPVIGTPLGGIPEIVGNAGWIISPNIDSWTTALPIALEQAAALSALARDRYLRLFSPAQVTGQLLEAYRVTLNQRGTRRHGDAQG